MLYYSIKEKGRPKKSYKKKKSYFNFHGSKKIAYLITGTKQLPITHTGKRNVLNNSLSLLMISRYMKPHKVSCYYFPH